jgi:hypothetical protein
MQFLRIVFVSIGAAIVYGVLHDLVTAHICVEYFSLGHPIIVPSDHPVVLALAWGVVATWWVGLILGLGLALAARLGRRPRLTAEDIWPDVLRLLRVMALVALLSGCAGYICSAMHWIWLVRPLSKPIGPERLNRFFFDAFAHLGSYLAGFGGGLVVIARTWRRRGSLQDFRGSRANLLESQV